jgi:hypothetical protein
LNALSRDCPSVDRPSRLPPVARKIATLFERFTNVARKQELPQSLARALVIFERLMNGPKARDVWRVLEKYDDRLIEDLIIRVCFKPVPVAVMSLKERDEFAKTLSLMVAMCQGESVLHADNDPERAAAFALVADYFEKKEREIKRKDPRWFVKNRTDDDEARAYVRWLGSETRRLTGGTRFSTVATIATIATIVLGLPISVRQVRNWCGGSGRHSPPA